MKKRVLCLLIALAMVLAISPQISAPVSAAVAGAGPRVLEGGKRDFAWPIPSNHSISSCFYDPDGHSHVHYALDIPGAREADIVAAYDGTVYKVLSNSSSGNSGYGNAVILKHSYTLSTGTTITLYTKYNHMNSIAVSEGQRVYKGTTRIGGVGGSGSSGPNTYPNHVDFQILYTKSGTLSASDYGNRATCSIDPFVNDLLEMPSDFSSGGASSWCTCCHDYADYVKELYKTSLCTHAAYNSVGVCASCGFVFDWEETFSNDCVGLYEVTGAVTPRTNKPYDGASKAGFQLSKATRVEVVGSYQNAFEENWYEIYYNGNTYYVRDTYLRYVGIASLRVTCTDFTPANQAVLQPVAQPVAGTVNSNYPLTSIYAYLDGEQYAYWQAEDSTTTQVNIQKTDINYGLSFSTLADGKHTIELMAYSYAHTTGVKVLTTVFYINEKPANTTPDGHLYGDANGDGTIDSSDVLQLRKYMANYNFSTGTSSQTVTSGGDANGDGVINGKDVVLMRQFMANYNSSTGTSTVVLGPN